MFVFEPNCRFAVVDNFFECAPTYRSYFEDVCSRPHQLEQKDFSWTYWFVPELYTYIKSYSFFPEDMQTNFLSHFRRWSIENMGLVPTGITTSMYVNGCGQELHNDSKNGSVGFVFSLTKWNERNFDGGETLIVQDQLGDYWRGRHRESGARLYIDKIPPIFSRFLLFDDRAIHGVRTVQGTMNPQDARLVIHGHLLAESAHTSGINARQAKRVVDQASNSVLEILQNVGSLDGLISLRMNVSTGENQAAVEILFDSLHFQDPKTNRATVHELLVQKLSNLRLPKQGEPYTITIPFTLGPE